MDFDEYITISESGSGDDRAYPTTGMWCRSRIHKQALSIGRLRPRRPVLAYDQLEAAQTMPTAPGRHLASVDR